MDSPLAGLRTFLPPCRLFASKDCTRLGVQNGDPATIPRIDSALWRMWIVDLLEPTGGLVCVLSLKSAGREQG